MSFYQFRQNNSGGVFTGPAINVIIEADSATAANDIAETVGLYFDGEGDCECCGDRWYEVSDYDAEAQPCIYGEPVESYDFGKSYSHGRTDVDCIVVFATGEQRTYPQPLLPEKVDAVNPADIILGREQKGG